MKKRIAALLLVLFGSAAAPGDGFGAVHRGVVAGAPAGVARAWRDGGPDR